MSRFRVLETCVEGERRGGSAAGARDAGFSGFKKVFEEHGAQDRCSPSEPGASAASNVAWRGAVTCWVTAGRGAKLKSKESGQGRLYAAPLWEED